MPKGRIEVRVIYAAVILFFVAFLGVPLATLFVRAFSDGETANFTLLNFSQVFSHPDFLSSLTNSLFLSALAALITTSLAFVLACAVNMARLPQWLEKLVPIAIAIPALFPTITYGFAIIYTFGRQGLITEVLGGHQLFEIYGVNGLLLGYVIYTLPIAYLLIDNGFRYVDKRFFIVSRIMGDGGLKAFFKSIFIPLAGTLGAAFVQAFALSFADFGIPAAVAGNVQVLSRTLFDTMLGAVPSFEMGAVVAIAMLLPSIMSVLILTWLDRFNINYKKFSPISLSKSRFRDVSLSIYTITLLLLMLSIFAVVFIIPFVAQWPWDRSFSVEPIIATLTNAQYQIIATNSIMFAAITAAVGTVLTFFAALIARRGNMPKFFSGSIDTFAIATNSIPGMVLGVAFLLFFVDTPLQNTMAILVLCTLVHLFSTPFLMFSGAFSRMNKSWELTAELMGDSWFKTLRRIIVPNVLPTVFEVFGYLFIYTMVTLSGVIFLVSAHTTLFATRINQLAYFARFEEIFILSLIIFVLNLSMRILTRYGARKATARLHGSKVK
ncbi:MAG: ABC transporter permease subunit [Coriobacteriia bacterium]|nr:ABC transporter permease subunit [Coriobacteriia bacterium]